VNVNHKNTICNILRGHLIGKPVSSQTGMVAKKTAEYLAGNRVLQWQYIHGEHLVLYEKKPQDGIVHS
jgi:type I restriction enzyme, R subunit